MVPCNGLGVLSIRVHHQWAYPTPGCQNITTTNYGGGRCESSVGERCGSSVGERCGSSVGERCGSSVGERCGSSVGGRCEAVRWEVWSSVDGK